MKIDILCNDGSPLGVTPDTIWGDDRRVGVGGAELALLTMAVEWTKEHEVVLYNNPWYKTGLLEQRAIGEFNPMENRDVLIIFRSPNHLARQAKGLRVWWSCDQYTVGDFQGLAAISDKIITISPRHQEFFKSHYGIVSEVIDIPVRLDDYEFDIPRVKNQLLFSSVPDRGLDLMARAFPVIRGEVPDVTLIVTSDYRLWGTSPNNHQYRHKFMNMRGVSFRGAVPRSELVQIQKSSDVLSYPCTYDELFCIAVAEAQVAGAYPITSECGAVKTTNMGTLISGSTNDRLWMSSFCRTIIDFLTKPEPEKERYRTANVLAAKERFSPENILKQWDEKVFADG